MLLLLPVGPCGHHPKIGTPIIVRVAILVVNMLSIALANNAIALKRPASGVALCSLTLHPITAVILSVIVVHRVLTQIRDMECLVPG